MLYHSFVKVLLYLSPLVTARITNVSESYHSCVPHSLQCAVADMKQLADFLAGEKFLLRAYLIIYCCSLLSDKSSNISDLLGQFLKSRTLYCYDFHTLFAFVRCKSTATEFIGHGTYALLP